MTRPDDQPNLALWGFQVTDGGFRDPAGRTGLVFGVQPAKVLAFGKSPYSQTRYASPSETAAWSAHPQTPAPRGRSPPHGCAGALCQTVGRAVA